MKRLVLFLHLLLAEISFAQVGCNRTHKFRSACDVTTVSWGAAPDQNCTIIFAPPDCLILQETQGSLFWFLLLFIPSLLIVFFYFFFKELCLPSLDAVQDKILNKAKENAGSDMGSSFH